MRRIRSLLLVLGLLSVACGPANRRSSPSGEAGSPGSWAHAFLTDTTFRSLVVTVDYMANEQPSPIALALLEQRLIERCNKPDGVVVQIGREIAPVDTTVYTDDAVISLLAKDRPFPSEGTRLAVYVAYLHGKSARDHAGFATLGLAPAATGFVVFPDAIRGGTPSEGTESAVLLQEVGHLLGLVGLGDPVTSEHQDPYHLDHCNNPACAMYWLIDGPNSGAHGGLQTIDYDAACLADMKANGGK